MTNDNQKGTFCILGQWLCPNFRTNCLYQGIKQYIKFGNIKASLLVDIPSGGNYHMKGAGMLVGNFELNP